MTEWNEMDGVLMTEEELPNFEELPAQEDLIDTEPWEVLVCLDACRWDAYQKVMGGADPVRTPSRASTIGWMKEIWCNPEYDWSDVTYISANDMTHMVGNDRKYFTDIPTIEESTNEYIGLGQSDWNNDLRAVPPWAFDNHINNLDTPAVLHFLQPHPPYTCGEFRFDIGKDDYEIVEENEDGTCWHRPSRLVRSGLVDKRVVQTAYLSNLESTTRVVKKIQSKYDTVVTADHGESFGPNRWDHGGSDTNRNRVVPWDSNIYRKT